MNKILIISYYYPPNTSIASWRPHSWAKYFSNGKVDHAEVHVICRYWDGNEKNWEDQINPSKKGYDQKTSISDNLFVHQIATESQFKKRLNVIRKVPVLNSLFYFGSHLSGLFHMETDACFQFKKYINKIFSKDYFEVVIVTSPPFNIIRLGYVLRKQFPKAFFVADFRDLWNNELINDNYKPTVKESFLDKLQGRFAKIWLKRYNITTSVSTALTDIIVGLGDFNTGVITNGYEKELFDSLQKKQTHKFSITNIGTIYEIQEYVTLAEGIIEFARQNNFNKNISINFIGIRSNYKLCKLLEENLPAEIIQIEDRIDRLTALQKMKDADILVYPGWPGYKGRYSGKIFEYLASGNNILIAPGDKDVIDELLAETKAGVSKNSKAGVVAQLQQWYDEWKEKGKISYHGLQDKIEKYSRESQAKKLAGYINGPGQSV